MEILKPSRPLVTVEWLHSNLDYPGLVILDASLPKPNAIEENQYKNARIKNALFFDIEDKFSDKNNPLPHMMPSPETFTIEAQKLGINNGSIIVVYDNTGLYSSPRAWWMFRAMGHSDVFVLDGGLQAWIEAGYPIETGGPAQIKKGDFTARYQPGMVCDYKEVLQALDDKSKLVMDARSEKRFTGEIPEPREGLRRGHMPNAVNLPFDRIQGNNRMLEKSELEKIFGSLADKDQQLIFSCGSGVTACVLALGADLAGYSNTKIYDGSWSEWGKLSDLPVVSNADIIS